MQQRSFIIAIAVAVLAMTGIIFFLQNQYKEVKFDVVAIFAGLGILTLVTLISYFTIAKGLKSDNTYALMRAKYAGTMIKFFTCIAALLSYIFIQGRENVNKPSLFLFLGMYVVFAAIEAITLSRLARSK